MYKESIAERQRKMRERMAAPKPKKRTPVEIRQEYAGFQRIGAYLRWQAELERRERNYNRLHAVRTSWPRIVEAANYVCVEETAA